MSGQTNRVCAPCSDCKTTKRDRSPCPLCGVVFCQRCAEKPYAFCCDGAEPIDAPTRIPPPTREQKISDLMGYAGHIRRRYLTEVDPAPVCGLLAMASELERRDRKRVADAAK